MPTCYSENVFVQSFMSREVKPHRKRGRVCSLSFMDGEIESKVRHGFRCSNESNFDDRQSENGAILTFEIENSIRAGKQTINSEIDNLLLKDDEVKFPHSENARQFLFDI